MSAIIGLLIAVFAASWASIFIRWCGDTPAIVISFYRMFWSTLIFLIYQLFRHPGALRFKNINRPSKFLLLVAGISLALHFGTWIASIQLTTISHSLILESTHPVFALILSPIFLNEKGGLKTHLAVVLTLLGIFIVAGQDLQLATGKFIGDLLALAGALFVTFYILIARHQRAKIDLIPYLIAVYGVATITLFFLMVLLQYPILNYPVKIHLMMLLLAIVPTIIGHSLINWAARKIEIYKVNFSILGEPIIASVLAYLFFYEKPYGLFYVGAILIVAGVVMALLDHSQSITDG
jgi:drug/metabolite transporter (DMT)-like permease